VLDLLESVYREWSAGNWSARFAFYADGMEWGWSDEFPAIAGVYRDDRTPNPRLQEWLCSWESWTCEAEDYVCAGETTVVVLTRYKGRGRGSGVEVDVEGAHVWTFHDGKAVRLEVFADRERALGVALHLVERLPVRA